MTAERLAGDLAGLPAKLDHVAAFAADDVIGGERATARDLQIGATLRVLLTIGDLAPLIEAGPGAELARRWFPITRARCPRGRSRRAGCRPPEDSAAMWLQREITFAPGSRGIHLVGREIVAALPELAELGSGSCICRDAHVGRPRPERERQPGRAGRPRAVARPRRPRRRRLLAPHARGPGRHAGPREGGAHRVVADAAGRRRRLALGTWQGIYLCEFRDRGGTRRVLATLQGDI